MKSKINPRLVDGGIMKHSYSTHRDFVGAAHRITRKCLTCKIKITQQQKINKKSCELESVELKSSLNHKK